MSPRRFARIFKGRRKKKIRPKLRQLLKRLRKKRPPRLRG